MLAVTVKCYNKKYYFDLISSIVFIFVYQVRPLRLEDFQKSMTVIRPSLSKSKWEELEQWNEEFGSN